MMNLCRGVTMETDLNKALALLQKANLFTNRDTFLSCSTKISNFSCIVKMCLCLGPPGSGKTLLMKRLQNQEVIDITSNPTPTVGVNLTKIKLRDEPRVEMTVREVGGAMAPIWRNYYYGAKEIIYVVDTSNLCQIASAGTMLYGILADPLLRRARILLVLTKMDVSYRQMRNEALLMLQMARLKKEVGREITVLEASAMSGEGAEEILEWLRGKKKVKPDINKTA